MATPEVENGKDPNTPITLGEAFNILREFLEDTSETALIPARLHQALEVIHASHEVVTTAPPSAQDFITSDRTGEALDILQDFVENAGQDVHEVYVDLFALVLQGGCPTYVLDLIQACKNGKFSVKALCEMIHFLNILVQPLNVNLAHRNTQLEALLRLAAGFALDKGFWDARIFKVFLDRPDLRSQIIRHFEYLSSPRSPATVVTPELLQRSVDRFWDNTNLEKRCRSPSPASRSRRSSNASTTRAGSRTPQAVTRVASPADLVSHENADGFSTAPSSPVLAAEADGTDTTPTSLPLDALNTSLPGQWYFQEGLENAETEEGSQETFTGQELNTEEGGEIAESEDVMQEEILGEELNTEQGSEKAGSDVGPAEVTLESTQPPAASYDPLDESTWATDRFPIPQVWNIGAGRLDLGSGQGPPGSCGGNTGIATVAGYHPHALDSWDVDAYTTFMVHSLNHWEVFHLDSQDVIKDDSRPWFTRNFLASLWRRMGYNFCTVRKNSKTGAWFFSPDLELTDPAPRVYFYHNGSDHWCPVSFPDGPDRLRLPRYQKIKNNVNHKSYWFGPVVSEKGVHEWKRLEGKEAEEAERLYGESSVKEIDESSKKADKSSKKTDKSDKNALEDESSESSVHGQQQSSVGHVVTRTDAEWAAFVSRLPITSRVAGVPSEMVMQSPHPDVDVEELKKMTDEPCADKQKRLEMQSKIRHAMPREVPAYPDSLTRRNHAQVGFEAMQTGEIVESLLVHLDRRARQSLALASTIHFNAVQSHCPQFMYSAVPFVGFAVLQWSLEKRELQILRRSSTDGAKMYVLTIDGLQHTFLRPDPTRDHQLLAAITDDQLFRAFVETARLGATRRLELFRLTGLGSHLMSMLSHHLTGLRAMEIADCGNESLEEFVGESDPDGFQRCYPYKNGRVVTASDQHPTLIDRQHLVIMDVVNSIRMRRVYDKSFLTMGSGLLPVHGHIAQLCAMLCRTIANGGTSPRQQLQVLLPHYRDLMNHDKMHEDFKTAMTEYLELMIRAASYGYLPEEEWDNQDDVTEGRSEGMISADKMFLIRLANKSIEGFVLKYFPSGQYPYGHIGHSLVCTVHDWLPAVLFPKAQTRERVLDRECYADIMDRRWEDAVNQLGLGVEPTAFGQTVDRWMLVLLFDFLRLAQGRVFIDLRDVHDLSIVPEPLVPVDYQGSGRRPTTFAFKSSKRGRLTGVFFDELHPEDKEAELSLRGGNTVVVAPDALEYYRKYLIAMLEKKGLMGKENINKWLPVEGADPDQEMSPAEVEEHTAKNSELRSQLYLTTSASIVVSNSSEIEDADAVESGYVACEHAESEQAPSDHGENDNSDQGPSDLIASFDTPGDLDAQEEPTVVESTVEPRAFSFDIFTSLYARTDKKATGVKESEEVKKAGGEKVGVEDVKECKTVVAKEVEDMKEDESVGAKEVEDMKEDEKIVSKDREMPVMPAYLPGEREAQFKAPPKTDSAVKFNLDDIPVIKVKMTMNDIKDPADICPCEAQGSQRHCAPACGKTGVCYDEVCDGNCGKVHGAPCLLNLYRDRCSAENCPQAHDHRWAITLNAQSAHTVKGGPCTCKANSKK